MKNCLQFDKVKRGRLVKLAGKLQRERIFILRTGKNYVT